LALFGLGLLFFARFFPKKGKHCITFDQLKEPAAGRNIFSLQKMLAQTSAEITPPLNQKSWLIPSQ